MRIACEVKCEKHLINFDLLLQPLLRVNTESNLELNISKWSKCVVSLPLTILGRDFKVKI